MAWRLAQSVVRGEIDNRTRGRVSGKLWLLGRAQPVALSLDGDCLMDIAGCRLVFENPDPVPGDPVSLAPIQAGVVGNMTASRKVRVPDVPVEEAILLKKAGRFVPEHTGNCLYLEWFSEKNGRVVVETADFRLEVSSPAWRMSEAEHAGQAEANSEAMTAFMQRLSETESGAREQADEEAQAAQDLPMDEFEWELYLRESDRRNEQYAALVEKYVDHPDRERLIAREMGWPELEEAFDQGPMPDPEAHGAEDDEPAFALDEEPAFEPDPLTEGVDWIRLSNGAIKHPLAHRAFELASRMWQACEQRKLLGETGDRDLHEMLFAAQTLGAKLAGALNSLAFREPVDGGLVVAYLKRGLKHFDRAMATADRVRRKRLLTPATLDDFRAGLFEIREEMLALMDRFRQERW
ncbi:MAG: hypothetical protein JXR37_17005 [Kiritimatiellae bacterium]|nr:hypothetical protein [Kiritimatiellia bacterium]